MAFPKLTGALSELEQTLERSATKIGEQAASVRKSLDEVQTYARQAETTLAETLDRARDRTRQQSEEIGSLVDQLLRRTGDQFDDLRDMLDGVAGPFADELQKQLDLLELGGTTVENIIRLFGDAQIEGKRLREILQGADFNKFQRDIQSLMKALRSGATEIDDILKFLNERGGDFGKTVAGWIQAFEKGEISLERFKKLVEGLQKEFHGTDLESFLDEIENAIEQGRI